METLTIELSEEVMADVNAAIAKRGMSAKDYALHAIVTEVRREKEATLRAHMKSLVGSFKPFDPDVIRRKHNIVTQPQTPEEAESELEAIVAAMTPEQRSALEALGWQ